MKTKPDRVQLLDTTLRDGSYAVDFQFSAQDTSIISFALEGLGFRWIEVGHGLGLYASRSGKGSAASSDSDYLKAASSVLSKARFGTFFIPGIGRKRDLDMAKEFDMDFVRIGTNANEIDEARKYIKYAKSLGFIVSVNLMKSYVLSPNELFENARKAVDWGADIVCLVDSAGGMLPEEIEAYFEKLSVLNNVILGFHGHDNLALATANALKAIECGATLIDVSMQGLGRSAGNAPMETLVAILKRRNMLADDIDFYKMLEFSHRIMSPISRQRIMDPISVISGYAKFHSSFTKIIDKYAKLYKVDPKELIVDLCAIDQVNASERMVKDLALKLHRRKITVGSEKVSEDSIKLLVERSNSAGLAGLAGGLSSLCRQLMSISKKHGKLSVINVVMNSRKRASVSGFIREGPYFVIGTVEVGDEACLSKVLKGIDGNVDYVLMDAESKIDVNVFDVVKHGIKRSKVIMYKDNDSWVRSIFSQLINISSHGNKRVVIFGLNNLSTKLATMLCEIGVEVILTAPDEDTDNVRAATASLNRLSIEGAKPVLFREFGPEAAAGADVVVGLAPGKAVVDSSAVKAMRKGGLIVDGSLGSLTPSAVRAANRLGIEMVRVDMGPAISAEVAMGIRMIDLVKKGMGRRKIDGVMCVAGGLFGSSGDVVLDSITDPNLVVGIADGRGGILRGVRGRQKNRNKVERIENSIALAKIV